jgi:hypothetical protein
MLHVTYEAVEDLEPGRLARIDEDRGSVQVLLDKSQPLARVVPQLNVEIEKLMASAHWFQLWEDEIVGCSTPGAPLRIEYLLHQVVPGTAIVLEGKGCVRVHIDPVLDTEQFAAAMNPATKAQLDAGQWFQMYGGEIINNSPES